MSSLLYESEAAWLVKLTAYKFEDGSSKSLYISKRYYAEDELYSGSPESFPLLANPPGIIESMSRTFGGATDQTLTILAKTSFMEFEKSFLDELREYEKERMTVEFYVYGKPRGGPSTHTASINTQLIGEVRGYSYDGDVINLTVRRSVLKEKEFNINFNNSSGELPSDIQDGYENEPLPIIVGEGDPNIGVITDVPRYGSSGVVIGARVNNHNYGDVQSVYILNNNRDLSEKTWIKANLSITDGYASNMRKSYITSPSGSGNLQSYELGIIIDQPEDFILERISFSPSVTSTPAAGESDIVLRLFKVESEDFATSKLIIGDQIHETKFGTNLISHLFPNNVEGAFFIGLPAGKYFATVDITNKTAATNVNYSYQTTTNTNGRYWQRNKSVEGQSFVPITEYIPFEAKAVYSGTLATTNSNVNGKYYSTATIFNLASSGNTPNLIRNNGTYKIGVEALKDNTSGTYTGSASSTLKRPSDIIHLILGHSSLLNLSSEVETTSFTQTRTNLDNKGIYVSFATEGKIYLVDFIAQLLEQSLCQLWRDRQNKIKIRFPTYTLQNQKFIYEDFEQEEMDILSVYESEANDVINDIEIQYDKTQIEIAYSYLLRAEAQRIRLAYQLSKDSSTDDDSDREDKASDSEDIYGNLPARLVMDMYPATSSAPYILGKMLFDRFYKKKKKVVVTLPLKRWLNTNLFDTIHTVNRLLESSESKNFYFYSSGSQIQFYRLGLKFQWKRKGSHNGEVLQVEKSDQTATLTIEEVLPF